MKAVVTLLRSWGINIIIYIDDFLVMSDTAALAAALRGVNSHPSMSGVHHQHREVSDDPNSGDRIPGYDHQLQYSAGQSSSRQDEADSGRGSQNIQHDLFVSPTCLIFWGSSVQQPKLLPQLHCSTATYRETYK